MMSPPPYKALAAALLAALLPLSAVAYEIFKWTDENGIVHYSESSPDEPGAPVETFHIESTNPPGYDPDDYYWSIENQADRIRAERDAIQEQKQEELEADRALDAERRLAELERRLAVREQPDYGVFRRFYGPPAFPKRHHRPVFNHGFSDRFDHGHVRRPPHHTRARDDTPPAPRPGWSDPQRNTAPPTPGFGSTGNP